MCAPLLWRKPILFVYAENGISVGQQFEETAVVRGVLRRVYADAIETDNLGRKKKLWLATSQYLGNCRHHLADSANCRLQRRLKVAGLEFNLWLTTSGFSLARSRSDMLSVKSPAFSILRLHSMSLYLWLSNYLDIVTSVMALLTSCAAPQRPDYERNKLLVPSYLDRIHRYRDSNIMGASI